MRAAVYTLAASLCIAALALAATPSSQPAGAAGARPWSRYEVVVDRNIFIRRAGTGGNQPRSNGPALSESGKGWVLSGTALMANDRVAFLENTRTGTTIRVHEGETTDGGQVVRIATDHFDLNNQGQFVTVPIGSTLDGRPREATAATQPATDTGETADAAQSATSAPSPPVGSTEAAMRARREQELSHH